MSPLRANSAAIRLTLLLSRCSRSASACCDSGVSVSNSCSANPWDIDTVSPGTSNWSGCSRPVLSLTGVDLSADMVTAAERNLGDRATVRVGSATELPFPDRSFDLVVSSISMHHWDRPEAAVPELARVLRPGGRLRIYDFRF